MFENIPEELRAYRQFVVWNLEDNESGRPTKVPYSPKTLQHASVTDSTTWGTYDDAISVKGFSGIGFVLTENDPYGFIDLDAPKDATPEESAKIYERQQLIFKEFNSYSELSPSGNGLHIIVKGSIPNGRKRSSVEVYSSLRYMTMTGNVFHSTPIQDRNGLFNDLWAEMGKGASAQMFYAGLSEASMADEAVIEMARNASNGEKFSDLFDYANWAKYYPSQSEADFALMDILAFYSQNAAQTQKLFLQSALAQRVKSRAQYRINYMLNRCFDKMLPPVDFEGLRDQVNAAIQVSQKIAATPKPYEINEGKDYLNLGQPVDLVDKPAFIYNPPIGLLGDIARYIYAQAPRPVPEIALAGAIGLMSGICGKAFNISGTGLNQYTLLLAATGTGKESANSGISKLMAKVKSLVPTALDFIGPSDISSQQALTKALSDNPSIISIVGEFGLYLKEMGADNASPHMMGLKKMLLKLYNVSGEGDKLGGMAYSDRDKNIASVESPAFSMFGETAPEPFYEALTENMLSGGLLPRFTIIEYLGDRVPRNKSASTVLPSHELVQTLATLCATAMGLINQRKVIHVQLTPQAEGMFDDLDALADKSVIGAMELRRQLWTRVHLKSLRLAALVAVGCNPFDPIIDSDAAKWAIDIVMADIKNMLSRFESGDVGVNNEETKQLKILNKLIKKFLTSSWDEIKKVAGENLHKLHQERIIPYGWLQRNTSAAPAFKTDRQGATNALRRTLKTLEERGEIQAMQKSVLVQKFGTSAQAYAILQPSAFGL